MTSSKKKHSSNESFNRVVPPVPVRSSDLDRLPSAQEVRVLPPIITGDAEEDNDSVVQLSLRTSGNVPPGSTTRKKVRTLLGFRVPRKYAEWPWYLLVLMALTSRRGLGTLLSFSFHLLLFILLSMVIFQTRPGARGMKLDVGFSSDPGQLELVEEKGVSLEINELPQSEMRSTPIAVDSPTVSDRETFANPVDTMVGSLPDPAQVMVATDSASSKESSSLYQQGGTTRGRSTDVRKHGLPGREGDTTEESERVVELGLKWLAEHQLPDGGWAFNLAARDRNDQPGSCRGQCSNTTATSGGHSVYRVQLHPSRMAATAISLLPFLGAGYTHTQSKLESNIYQKTVYSGLEFIKYGTRTTPNGFDFRGGLLEQGMYIQGIVTLMLCEAYEMTGDETIRQYAQEGLRFIEFAQREDGGWRYHTKLDTDYFKDASSDTTVTGWQVLAIKSGISAGLQVRPSLMYRVGYFLDNVQSNDVGLYHYIPLKNEKNTDEMWGTTSVGLLIRQYLGWKSDHPGMARGLGWVMRWIAEDNRDWQSAKKQGEKATHKTVGGRTESLFRPAPNGPPLFVHNLYFTYYSMLLLNNYGGSDWHRAFKQTRQFLIESQATTGHELGSWLFYDQYLNDGGRLLNTALAVLILETPYRYLPMYQ